MDYGTEYTLPCGSTVELIDANHCPGAVLLLFTLKSGRRLLHTGDFRANNRHLDHHELRSDSRPIDNLYLDTTYCRPEYAFPARDSVLSDLRTLAR